MKIVLKQNEKPIWKCKTKKIVERAKKTDDWNGMGKDRSMQKNKKRKKKKQKKWKKNRKRLTLVVISDGKNKKIGIEIEKNTKQRKKMCVLKEEIAKKRIEIKRKLKNILKNEKRRKKNKKI